MSDLNAIRNGAQTQLNDADLHWADLRSAALSETPLPDGFERGDSS